MEHLVDHLRNDLLPTVQGEDAIVPEGVTQRSADVDEIELVVTVFVGKGCDDAVISVTDDRRVVSDCADISSSAAVSSQSALTDRSSRERDFFGGVFAERWTGGSSGRRPGCGTLSRQE